MRMDRRDLHRGGLVREAVIPVPVTLHSRERNVPPFVTTGHAPSIVCVLAVTPFALWDAQKRVWAAGGEDQGFMIVHRPTGLALGFGLVSGELRVWDTIAEAMAVLERCDPTFPAWALAGDNEAARTACRVKFRWATQHAADQ